MPDAPRQPVLRVQTVLFRNEPVELWRLLHGLAAAATRAVEAGVVGAVEWAMGDCSPVPVLQAADAEAMALDAGDALRSVSYEFFDENLGSSGGHNRLAAGHPSDLLVTLNPDTYPSPLVFVEMVGALADETVGIAEARQLPLEHPKAYDPVAGDTSWASTCCIVVRRAIFDELGGFDHDTFPLYCDDVDFSWRVRALGHRVVVAPFATVFHDKRPRHDGVWPASDVEVYHSTLGRLMLATRWDRPDILEETIDWIEANGAPMQEQALADYRARALEGRVPAAVPDAAAVAEFIGGEYAVHRF